jgi:UDP-N-acetylglucosamine--N-acetylmuramyl-(pentapeptide) pyrophosphoryl-undecaprenol N-acetylglucosamine transferase
MSAPETIVLAGGGTGGHFYPALAVAECLRARSPGIDLHYIGTKAGAEANLAPASGFRYDSVPSGQVRGQSAWKAMTSLASMAAGAVSARSKVDGAKAVFATGGYASVPVVAGAWLRGVPVVIFLPDVEPGWAVRSTARMARRIGVSNGAGIDGLPADKTEVTGYPTRKRFSEVSREDARKALGLPLDGRVVLVSGASTGAQRINDAILGILPGLLEIASVVHSTGPANYESIQAQRDQLTADQRDRYHVYPLVSDMAAAMRAADLAVMRAGASVLGELPAARLPSILIPGTFGGGHQRANAEALASTGAALVLEERDFNRLLPLIKELLAGQERLDAMAAAAKGQARPDAADRLAEIVLEVAR